MARQPNGLPGPDPDPGDAQAAPSPKKTHSHHGHRQRLKAEFLEKGMDHFPPHRVLELMLFYVRARGDTNELAHNIIDRFGSLSSALEAPRELLLEVDGVGEEMATYIKALQAFSRAYAEDTVTGIRLDSREAAKEYVRAKFLGSSAERVYLICLGSNHKILQTVLVAQGTPETVHLDTRELIRHALLANAVKVMLAHNHPYGVCNPSRQDKTTTMLLFQAFAQVGVELADHLIVGTDDVCSMMDSGVFPALPNR